MSPEERTKTMATFKYVARDENSRNVTGKIVAQTQQEVIEELRKRKFMIVSVSEVKGGGLSFISLKQNKVNPDDLVIFSRQLATMIEAGIPILQSLEALQEQISSAYFKTVIGAIKEDVEVGSSLTAAFAKHPKVFDTLFINMVKVGEAGGKLNVILDRVSSYMEKTLKLKRKVKAALVYPTVVVIMAMAITLVLLVKVVPTFKAIYDSLGHELPAMTKFLIMISDVLQKYILAVFGVSFLSGILFNRYAQTEKGQLQFDTLKLKVPIFGELMRKVAISRFSRTFATLTQSGVPILASLEIVGKTCGNKLLEITINNVRNLVREGESITPPLVKSGVFPPMVTRMIAVGEKTGEMEKMLVKVADFYDDQVDAAVAGLTSLIEPVVIAFLGVVVGFIVIALFMPIITMTTMLK